MVSSIAFRIFISCLLVCASMVLIGIWFGENVFPEEYFKVTFSFFVVGLASFLIWFSLTLRSILEHLRSLSKMEEGV